MSYDAKTGDLNERDDLLFKTIDGNDISLDIVIQYQIDASKAPHILQYVGANDRELKSFIRSFARSIPRDIFGELTTEEFYEQAKRQEKGQKVKRILNQILLPYGVIVHNVLSKDYRFNPAYQQAIEDKKVADQLVEKNRSAKRATVEEYLKKREKALGEVNKINRQRNQNKPLLLHLPHQFLDLFLMQQQFPIPRRILIKPITLRIRQNMTIKQKGLPFYNASKTIA